MGGVAVADGLPHDLHRTPAVGHLCHKGLELAGAVEGVVLGHEHRVGGHHRVVFQLHGAGDDAAQLIAQLLRLGGAQVDGQLHGVHHEVGLAMRSTR